MAGEALEDNVIREATEALKSGGGQSSIDAKQIFEANKELWSLHELIAHRLFQILVGAHQGRKFV
jgi:xylose isomerase